MFASFPESGSFFHPGRPLAEAKVEDLRTAVDCAAFFRVPSLYGTPGTV